MEGVFVPYLAGENPCRYVAMRATYRLADFRRIGFVASQKSIVPHRARKN
jgi:hypothetical protein